MSSPRSIIDGAGLKLLALCLALWSHPAAAVAASDWSSNSLAAILPAPTNSTPASPAVATATNLPVLAVGDADSFEAKLVMAQNLAKAGQPDGAEPMLISLLTEKVPDSIRQSALFELGAVVRMKNDLPRAVAICTQFIDRWPQEPRVPEVLLRQGQIYRQMGLNNLALTKFYAVMTTALALKSDQPGYYPGLVLQAQIEIAESHYLMGRYEDAAEFYTRLLKQTNPALNRPQAQFRLVRSLNVIGNNDEVVSQAQVFLANYPDAPEQPEVRFYLAQTFKKMGRNNDALQQVLFLLKEEKSKTESHPELWAYWQLRAGNEVANQLYREGDYLPALGVYLNLAQLDASPAWQLPVKYQIGLTYERLQQPEKAVITYNEIVLLEPALGTNATPGQKAVIDMARWRAGFLGWQDKAEASNRSLAALSGSHVNALTNEVTISRP